MSEKIDSRSEKEKKDAEYNYYHAFKIDPNEKDDSKIKTIIAQKKNQWTVGTVSQRRLLQLVNEAVDIMVNPVYREEENQIAKQLKLNDAKMCILSKANNLGYLYKSDYRKLADNSDKWLTIDDIEKATEDLIQQGVKLIDDTQKSLDFICYENIDKLLKTIGKKDLYEFLSKPETLPVATLFAEVDVVYKSVSPALATEPKNNAIQKVCGEARKVFKDDNTKKYYDIYLATKEVWDDFSKRQDWGISQMEMKEYLAYSEKVKTALNTSDVDFVGTILAEGLGFYKMTVLGGDNLQFNLSYSNPQKNNYDNTTSTVLKIEKLLLEVQTQLIILKKEMSN